jgi:hypothetical protein
MKKFVIALVAFFGLGAAVQAADVSSDMLSKMGLGGMQQMTDAQGLAIRGMGNSVRVRGDVRITNNNTSGTNFGNFSQTFVQNGVNDGDIDTDQDAETDIEIDLEIDIEIDDINIGGGSKYGKKRGRRGHGGYGGGGYGGGGYRS